MKHAMQGPLVRQEAPSARAFQVHRRSDRLVDTASDRSVTRYLPRSPHSPRAALRTPTDSDEDASDRAPSIAESTLGHDFSQVRLHSDGRAEEAATAVDVRRYWPGTIHADAAGRDGNQLEPTVRMSMERSFGQSFADVVLHTDSSAAAAVDRIGASAYTVGQHVVFGSGEYDPGTVQGRMLIAHELAHVIQQRRGRSSSIARPTGTDRAAEADADRAAASTLFGAPVAVSSSVPVAVACAEKRWNERILDAAKEQVRNKIEGAIGITEGVLLDVGNIVDTIVWVPYAEINAVDWAVNKAADAGGLTSSHRETLRAAAHAAAMDNASLLKPFRERARSAGAVDPVTGAPAVSPLIAKAGDALETVTDQVWGSAGLKPEQGLLTSREQGQIEGALGLQAALAIVGEEEAQLALKAVGGAGAVKAIVTAAQKDPEGYVRSKDFWLAIGNLVLHGLNLRSASAGKKLLAYFVDTASLTLATAPSVFKFIDDLANVKGPDRDKILHKDLFQVTMTATQALQQIIQHAATMKKAGGKASPPELQGGQAADASPIAEPHSVKPTPVEAWTATSKVATNMEPESTVPATEAETPASGTGAESVESAPFRGFEPTALSRVGDVKSRRVAGLQSSGEQQKFSPKPGTLTDLVSRPDIGRPRQRDVTREEQLYGVPSPEDWGRTRSATPSKQLQSDARQALPVGSVDPAFPSLKVTESAQADHIVSVDAIRRKPGFAQLDDAAQQDVFNLKKNIIALSATANKSKGSKRIAEWTHHEKLGLPVDPVFRAEALAQETQLDSVIQERINEHLREGHVTKSE